MTELRHSTTANESALWAMLELVIRTLDCLQFGSNEAFELRAEGLVDLLAIRRKL